ncbi:hypothetical protein E2562_032586 [Oryza meyeriana var. granulata]|uniref:Uncharacterized protein n=1 Tax=Oryza meyeriana var. granulata TaxID=110450 RepID=A0A6G1ED51_9ORYZ|nr:hypothetical protein E2562_032586 [Oryza meyeriana var. granulata]
MGRTNQDTGSESRVECYRDSVPSLRKGMILTRGPDVSGTARTEEARLALASSAGLLGRYGERPRRKSGRGEKRKQAEAERQGKD